MASSRTRLHTAASHRSSGFPDRASIARGSAMECAAVLDVMRVQRTIEDAKYELGISILTSVVAMLTKMCQRAL